MNAAMAHTAPQDANLPANPADQAQDPRTALVVFSGGQDSTVCLAWALSRYQRVETVGFDYGQRHRVELHCRSRVRSEIAKRFPQWGERLGSDHLMDLRLLGQLSDTALTETRAIEMQANGLPNTFVPARRLGVDRWHVRDRLLRLPRLPRQHAQGLASGHQPGPGHTHDHRDPADVADQSPDLGLERATRRPCAERPDH
jgi:hypothetical protein